MAVSLGKSKVKSSCLAVEKTCYHGKSYLPSFWFHFLGFILLNEFTSVKAEDVSTTAPTTPPLPFCSFCGDGRLVDEPNTIVTVDLGLSLNGTSSVVETETCSFFENAFLLLKECPAVPETTRTICCSGTAAPTTPTNSPTLVPPTSSTDEPTGITPSFERCACQPSRYIFEFSASSGCDPENDAFRSKGIESETCRVDSAAPSDSTFALISNVFVAEFGADGVQVQNRRYVGPFQSGDLIEYPSIVLNDDFDIRSLPKSLGMVVTGSNADGDEILAQWSVVFTSECDTFPVIEGNEQTAGVIFRQVDDPLVEYCPLVTTLDPTNVPTLSPSQEPTAVSPTLAPTNLPTVSESSLPSDIVTLEPPTIPTISQPVELSPVISPISEPTTSPPTRYTMIPSMSLPSRSPSTQKPTIVLCPPTHSLEGKMKKNPKGKDSPNTNAKISKEYQYKGHKEQEYLNSKDTKGKAKEGKYFKEPRTPKTAKSDGHRTLYDSKPIAPNSYPGNKNVKKGKQYYGIAYDDYLGGGKDASDDDTGKKETGSDSDNEKRCADEKGETGKKRTDGIEWDFHKKKTKYDDSGDKLLHRRS